MVAGYLVSHHQARSAADLAALSGAAAYARGEDACDQARRTARQNGATRPALWPGGRRGRLRGDGPGGRCGPGSLPGPAASGRGGGARRASGLNAGRVVAGVDRLVPQDGAERRLRFGGSSRSGRSLVLRRSTGDVVESSPGSRSRLEAGSGRLVRAGRVCGFVLVGAPIAQVRRLAGCRRRSADRSVARSVVAVGAASGLGSWPADAVQAWPARRSAAAGGSRGPVGSPAGAAAARPSSAGRRRSR